MIDSLSDLEVEIDAVVVPRRDAHEVVPVGIVAPGVGPFVALDDLERYEPPQEAERVPPRDGDA
jgi:hypothetical protein